MPKPARNNGQRGDVDVPGRQTKAVEASAREEFAREFPGASQSANATAVALVRTAAALTALFDEALRPLDLSASARQALAVLEGAGGTLSPTTLSERMMVTTASITSLLGTLERRGLITRLSDPTDRRKQLVSITDAGRELVNQVLPALMALQTAVMTELSEPQRRLLQRMLEIVREAIDSTDTSEVVSQAAPRVPPSRIRPRAT